MFGSEARNKSATYNLLCEECDAACLAAFTLLMMTVPFLKPLVNHQNSPRDIQDGSQAFLQTRLGLSYACPLQLRRGDVLIFVPGAYEPLGQDSRETSGADAISLRVLNVPYPCAHLDPCRASWDFRVTRTSHISFGYVAGTNQPKQSTQPKADGCCLKQVPYN